MIKFDHETYNGYRIKVDMKGTIEEYAINFLKIYNTVKSSPELKAVYNDYDNGVYVVCEEDSKESVEEWLSNFGTIEYTRPVTIISPWLEYDSEDLDELGDFEILQVEE